MPAVVLSFHNDGGKDLLSDLDVDDHPGIEEALHSFIGVVREQLEALCRLREFKHVIIQETEDPFELDADGELLEAVDLHSPFNIEALLTANSKVTGSLGSKVAFDEDGVLQIVDKALESKVDRILARLKIFECIEAALDEDAEILLVEGLAELAPPFKEGEEDKAWEPMHPADLLTIMVAYMIETIGEAPSQPNPFHQAGAFLGGLLSSAVRRVRAARKLVWKTEDIAVGGVKLALGIARRAARPLLIGFVVHRALSTVENARLPACRTARMSPAERLEYENTRLMGADWRQQFEQDLIDAAKEVQDGFITDDYKEEKRKMSAAMLRRLEIEDWDKERMRHFYYGSYGLGPWYFDMEERLHNPYFIGARAWNGPIEGWVGKNKKYDDDIPISNVDWNSAALDMIEKKRGIRLTPAQRSRIIASQGVATNTDILLDNSLIGGMIARSKLKNALAK